MAQPTTQIALLRAINLAGRNLVAMADLRRCLAECGMIEPRTLLQSGNAIFRSRTAPAAVESRLESEARSRWSLAIEVMVRTSAEWAAVIDGNPFPKEARNDPSHLLVMFLKSAPGAAAVRGLQQQIKDRELVHAVGRELFVTYPDGVGRSRLSANVIEKALGTRGTARNWNTVVKIQALAEQS
jgi:uncharacterized protein (DUF1697 family)